MSAVKELQCYNRGCGSKYNPDENKQDSCTYHPGAPFFHDAYKGWSCCKKKTVDFTEFLNTKGCTKGFHSDVKPVEPEKPQKEASPPSREQQIFSPQTPNRKLEPPAPRPPFDSPMTELPCTVAPSLSQALKQRATDPARPEAADAGQLQPGTSCKNGGCKETYGSCSAECRFHSGVPIFHEGMKYWSCCQRKTSDFSAFLAQEGCTTGDHLWIKKKEGDARRTSCRYDWHQTGSHVIVAVYAKLARPERSRVLAGPVRLRPHIEFGDDQEFEVDLELRGLVDPAQSSVQLLGSKVEIKLKKAEPLSWSQLSVARTEPAAPPAARPDADPSTDAMTQRVDAVDLSGL
ncbi:cysteine and histidine-rich domain-containing protein 1-like [Pollicipes pollicipes]|uniref:cysteine and histidine-rich domain-containing protein 1-like n=1 Tax=Pollicipes pollicipes TaxID=41117 RepID=UPI00188534A9|nr:cysteine and histidine-rich domain-containing protein 1-like [Pollicipes pollicipes]